MAKSCKSISQRLGNFRLPEPKSILTDHQKGKERLSRAMSDVFLYIGVSVSGQQIWGHVTLGKQAIICRDRTG